MDVLEKRCSSRDADGTLEIQVFVLKMSVEAKVGLW